MSTHNDFENLKPKALTDPAHMVDPDVCLAPRKQPDMSGEITIRFEPKGFIAQCRAFIRDCWRSMGQMKAQFER